jgi:hypothetical protein
MSSDDKSPDEDKNTDIDEGISTARRNVDDMLKPPTKK